MANTKSAAKRARQTVTRTKQNRRVLTAVKSQTKAVRMAVKAGNRAEIAAALPKLSSIVDRAAKSGRIHKNRANRLKSRAAKALAKLPAEAPAS